MNRLSQCKLLFQNKRPVRLRNKSIPQNENRAGCTTVNVYAIIASKELTFSFLTPSLKHFSNLS